MFSRLVAISISMIIIGLFIFHPHAAFAATCTDPGPIGYNGACLPPSDAQYCTHFYDLATGCSSDTQCMGFCTFPTPTPSSAAPPTLFDIPASTMPSTCITLGGTCLPSTDALNCSRLFSPDLACGSGKLCLGGCGVSGSEPASTALNCGQSASGTTATTCPSSCPKSTVNISGATFVCCGNWGGTSSAPVCNAPSGGTTSGGTTTTTTTSTGTTGGTACDGTCSDYCAGSTQCSSQGGHDVGRGCSIGACSGDAIHCYIPAACTGGGGSTGGSTTKTSDYLPCGATCTSASQCHNPSGPGSQISVDCIGGVCQNTQCVGKTIPGDQCQCSSLNACGTPCGANVGLCQAGSVCRYVNGPACTLGSVAVSTTYCAPNTLPDGWATNKCVGRDIYNSYVLNASGANPTVADLQSACAPAPICLQITSDHPTPAFGDSVSFTCGPVGNATRYEFRYRVDPPAEATGAASTIPAIDFLVPVSNGSPVTKPLAISKMGTYKVQCRPCSASGCAAWTENW